MYSRIAQIFSSKWLINQEAVMGYLPVLLSFIHGNEQAVTKFFSDDDARNKPFVVKGDSTDIDVCTRYELEYESDDIAPNSVAIIPIQDAMDGCKNMRLAQYLQMADENPNIIAKLLLVNSPGGAVFYTDIAAKQIKDGAKPTVAHTLQMCASAAMWLVSGCKQISASSPIDRLGSIGVMTSAMDTSRMMKDLLKIDTEDIYATKSTRKNEEVRAYLDKALKNDERKKLIIEELDFVNEIFHQAIQTNLGVAKESEIFTGAMYYAQQAIGNKLCNKICTINEALNDAYNYGLANQLSSLNYKFNK